MLLLDEPTNDLDVHVLRNLENAIEQFAGMYLLPSVAGGERDGQPCITISLCSSLHAGMVLHLVRTTELVFYCCVQKKNITGCVVVVSHDRWFLDRVCTDIIAFEGDGRVVHFEGSYGDYMEQKQNSTKHSNTHSFIQTFHHIHLIFI